MNIVFKILLSPFALLYLLLTKFRNHLFNIGYTKSFQFETVVIGVGNLAVGGSGKTPMVEHIVELLLSKKKKVATLSRGYKRKTMGYLLASDQDNAFTLGDEPYQFYLKFGKKATIAVGEERALAIPSILFDRPETQVIVLDDAFQHRYVVPNLNILLSDYSRPFYQDLILPWGRLRESRDGAKRADAIVVTKCPDPIDDKTMANIETRIRKYAKTDTAVFFTQITYQSPIPVFQSNNLFYENIVLLTGIANNEPLIRHVSGKYNLLETIAFPDHHFYTDKDVIAISEKFHAVKSDKKTLLTTEKDMVKLLNLQHNDILNKLSLFYLPIKVRFVKNGKAFENLILDLF